MPEDDAQRTSPQRLDYRGPAPEPKSQWITDDHPGGFWVVGCLTVLTALGVIGGAIWGVVALLAGC